MFAHFVYHCHPYMILISTKSFYYLLHFGFFIFLPLYCTCMYTCNHKILATLLSSQFLPMLEKKPPAAYFSALTALCRISLLVAPDSYMYIYVRTNTTGFSSTRSPHNLKKHWTLYYCTCIWRPILWHLPHVNDRLHRHYCRHTCVWLS